MNHNKAASNKPSKPIAANITLSKKHSKKSSTISDNNENKPIKPTFNELQQLNTVINVLENKLTDLKSELVHQQSITDKNRELSNENQRLKAHIKILNEKLDRNFKSPFKPRYSVEGFVFQPTSATFKPNFNAFTKLETPKSATKTSENLSSPGKNQSGANHAAKAQPLAQKNDYIDLRGIEQDPSKLIDHLYTIESQFQRCKIYIDILERKLQEEELTNKQQQKQIANLNLLFTATQEEKQNQQRRGDELNQIEAQFQELEAKQQQNEMKQQLQWLRHQIPVVPTEYSQRANTASCRNADLIQQVTSRLQEKWAK
jgi:hypothetical protein